MPYFSFQAADLALTDANATFSLSIVARMFAMFCCTFGSASPTVVFTNTPPTSR